MVKLSGTFSRLNSAKVLVIGDLMLDTYTIGKASRISPEAPVAVIHVHHEDHRAGGAGNVALNLISLGAEVVVIGRVGSDRAGESILQSLKKEKIDISSICIQDRYQTPIKNRVIAENQQIVRIDHESVLSFPENLEQLTIESLENLFKEIQVIAISDYGKGFLTSTLLSAIFSLATQLKIPVVTDPKGGDFAKYMGTTVIKPNLSEAFIASNLPRHTALEIVAKKIIETTGSEMLMITRSEEGISLFEKNQRFDFPVHAQEIKDVTGAGDTVLAMLTFAIANCLSYSEAAQLCNIAAGIAIEHVGCARITLSDLAYRLLEKDVNNKVFDEDHLYPLQEVLKNRKFVLLTLVEVETLSSQLFLALENLSKQNVDILIYLNNSHPDDPFIKILASLKEVNFILIHQESLKQLCEKVGPFETYLFKNQRLEKVPHFSVFFEPLFLS